MFLNSETKARIGKLVEWVRTRRSFLSAPTLILVLVGIIGVYTLLWWLVPIHREYSGNQEDGNNVSYQIEFVKIMAQIALGVLVLGTLCVAWRRATAAERTVEVAQEGQITERFTRAIDQLGNSDMVIRLGGIYALERIAKGSPKDHWQVMEVLTAYVREKNPTNRSQDQPQAFRPIPFDIQAILEVLGRRNTEHENPNQSLNLRMTDLRGAELEGADLRRVDLRFAGPP